MSVNRPARDALANALAAYMKGEIDNLEFARRVDRLPADDETVNRFVWQCYFLYDDFRAHPLEVTAECWQTLVRMLAFLKTDLSLQRVTIGRRWFHRGQVPAVLLLLALAALLWWVRNPSLVLVGWTALGLFHFRLWQSDHKAPESEPWTPDELYFPFESAGQATRYAHLADAFALPAYRPPERDDRPPLRHPLVSALMTLGAALLMAALFPLWCLLSLRPRKIRRWQVVPPAAS